MPVRRGGRLLSDADALSHIREAWARQELQPRLRVNLPPIQLHPQPSPSPRVRVQMPRIAVRKPTAQVKPPPVDVLEEDAGLADLRRSIENFKQESLAPDAERLMFSALLAQHHKTGSHYAERIRELEAENLALKNKIGQISESLQCPISYEVFRDPVMIRDGHTYERVSIEGWFARGNTTSPVTREQIPNPRFRINFAVKHVLEALARE
jgi:hypothetical protein